MKLQRLFYSLGCGAALFIAHCASAQAAPEANPKGESPAAQAPGMRGKDKGRPEVAGRSEGRPERHDGEHRPSPSAVGGPGPMPSGSAGPGERRHHPEDGNAGDRKERRKHHVKELRRRWGEDTLRKPAVHNELKQHAWRLARLKRLRELASEKKNDKLLAKLEVLGQKEQARHEKAMAKHQQGGAAPSASGGPVPQAAPSAAVQGGKQ